MTTLILVSGFAFSNAFAAAWRSASTQTVIVEEVSCLASGKPYDPFAELPPVLQPVRARSAVAAPSAATVSADRRRERTTVWIPTMRCPCLVDFVDDSEEAWFDYRAYV